MPIKGESLNVVQQGIDTAIDYLAKQSDETWGQKDSDPARAKAIELLHRARHIVHGERKHIEKVAHLRELRRIGEEQR